MPAPTAKLLLDRAQKKKNNDNIVEDPFGIKTVRYRIRIDHSIADFAVTNAY